MKLRILVYGFLALLVSAFTTLYLVYANRERILDAASFRLATMARERWGVDLDLPASVLDLPRNAAVFRDVHLATPDGRASVDLKRLEMSYSLASLLRGEVRFTRIFLAEPKIEVALTGEESGAPGPGGQRLPFASLAALQGVVDRLQVEDGSLEVTGADGGTVVSVDGLSLDIAGGRDSAVVRIWADGIAPGVGPWRGLVRRGFVRGEVSPRGMTFSRLDLAADAGRVGGSGRLESDGTLEMDLEIEADLKMFSRDLAVRVPLAGSLAGTAHLVTGAGTWRLEGPARTRSLTLFGEPIPDCEGKVLLTPGRCLFRDLAAPVRGGGEISGEGRLVWGAGPFAWGFALRARAVPPGRVAYLVRHFDGPWMAEIGALSGRIDFGTLGAREPGSWEVLLDVSGAAPRWFGEHTCRVAGSISGGPGGGAVLSDFSVEAGTLKGSLSGTAGKGEAALGVIAGADDLADALRPFGLDWIGGRGSFGGDVVVREGALSVSGGVTAENPRVRGVAFDRADGRLRYAGGTWELDGLTLARGDGRAVLELSVAKDAETWVEATLSLDDLPAADAVRLLESTEALSGNISGKVLASGPPAGLSGSGVLSSPLLEVRGHRLTDVSADFSFSPGKVVFRRLSARREGLQASFSGRWAGRPADARVEGELVASVDDLQRFLPGRGFEGRLEFRGTVAGELASPAVRGEVTLRGARFRGVPLAEQHLAVESTGRQVLVRGSLPGGHGFSATVALEKPWPARGVLETGDLSLAEVLPFLPRDVAARLEGYLDPAGTRAAGRVQVSLDLGDAGGFRGEAEVADLTVKLGPEVSRSRRPLRLVFDRDGVRLERAFFEGAGHRFTLAGTFGPRILSADLQGSIDLSFLGGRLPGVGSLEGRPDVSVTVTGTPAAPEVSGGARLRGGRLVLLRPARELRDLDADVGFDGRTVTLRSFSASLSPGRVEGSGTLRPWDQLMELRLQGELPAETLGLDIPGVRELTGLASFEAVARGAPASPSVDAEVTLSGGVARLSGYATPLREVSIRAAVSDEYVRIREAGANLGGGRLKGSGYLVLPGGGDPGEVDLDVAAERVPLSWRSDFRSILSADLSLRGVGDRRRLSGRVTLDRGKYTRDLSPRPLLPLQRATEGSWRRSLASLPEVAAMQLDVRVTAGEGLWIENNVARINAGLDLHLGGTVLEPLVSGEVLVQRGDIFYLGKKFRLEEVTLSFPGRYPPDPRVNVQAQASVSGVTIGLVLQGTLASMELDLWSDPPYSREDIVSLLTLGAPRNSLENRGRQVSTVGAAMAFSGPLLNRIEEQTRDFTGLEIFQIEPTLSDTGGAARVVVGKTFSERVFVSYARSLSPSGDDQFTMEYQLLDFLSLVGHQDRRGQYSFDLVFSIGGRGWSGR